MIALKSEAEADYRIVEGLALDSLFPMKHHLLVRWLDRKETKGGILMPENRQRMGIMKGILLRVGPECDPRLGAGQTIQFVALCEKEFLGGETPGDRDPVFFMREEYVIGIHRTSKDLELLNDFLFIRQDQEADQRAGIKIINRDQRTVIRSGIVIKKDENLDSNDVAVSNRVFYHSNAADEMKLGDFDGELVHVVRWRSIEMVSEASQDGA